MLFFREHINGADLLIWQITESVKELTKMIPDFSVYAADFSKLKTEKRQLEFLAARVAFHLLVNNSGSIVYDEDGKPGCLSNEYNLSISHTQDKVAVLVHSQKKAGIDIEAPTPKFEKLYSRFLSEMEQKYLYSGENTDKVALAWCAKEALYKIIGNEAVNFSQQLEVNDFLVAKEGHFTARHLVRNELYVMNYICFDDFYLVYCIK